MGELTTAREEKPASSPWTFLVGACHCTCGSCFFHPTSYLADLRTAAAELETESGIAMEHDNGRNFREAVLEGDWTVRTRDLGRCSDGTRWAAPNSPRFHTCV